MTSTEIGDRLTIDIRIDTIIRVDTITGMPDIGGLTMIGTMMRLEVTGLVRDEDLMEGKEYIL